MGQRIHSRLDELGWSVATLRDEMIERLPRNARPTVERVRRYADGGLSFSRMDYLLVCAMADALGCTVYDLSPELASGLPRVKELVATVKSR